jgi:putative sterol carrier protein
VPSAGPDRKLRPGDKELLMQPNGTHPSPELTVTADTADVLVVADGKLDPTQAFMQGKAKVKGDLTEALDLVKVFLPK